MSLDGYKLIRADHPNNTRRGGVCIYHKESLTVHFLDVPALTECLLCEINFKNKKGYLSTLYRSPSQNTNEFDNFLFGFEQLLSKLVKNKPPFIAILGDFNARLSNWWNEDITTIEGTHIDSLASENGLKQMITEPTHILHNSSSCIDLIFTDQPNLMVDCGVHPSLHPNSHHQIIYCKFNLSIEYPPPYQRLVWDYKSVNADPIRTAIENFDWQALFSNKNAHKQVEAFNTTLLNIFSNYIPTSLLLLMIKILFG